MKNGLIIFAREPIAGRVKTRLAASIGDQVAAELYEAMLRDVLKSAEQLSDVEIVVFWACEEKKLPVLAEQYRCNSRCQGPGDLGQRMEAAFDDMFASGCAACCIIGSDAPDLPLSYIQDAYRLLETLQSDVVLGPSRDGGYYLLGMQQARAELFTGIPWSSATVRECTLRAARASGLTVALLDEWQDIDTEEDLVAYQERIRLTLVRETT